MSIEKSTIWQAYHEGDHDRLRRMARKGGLAAAETKRLEKEEREKMDALNAALREERQAQETAKQPYKISPEGDILPPDEILPLES